MDLTEYRNSISEKARVDDLMRLLPGEKLPAVLDIGARDGFISKLLIDHCSIVTALDLEQPAIEHERIRCVKGDITALYFADASFNLVFCAEVLEHIPTHLLRTACLELARVSSDYVLIGVPYKQDIRCGRSTCGTCGKINPPWGHVNRFDEDRLRELFPEFTVIKQSFVGETDAQTNALSCGLMDMAGNPYGTYSQQEPCINCGASLKPPPERRLWQKVLTKVAFTTTSIQKKFVAPHPNWIHMLLHR
ncbi:MAG: class I SAM-dependent methyltransferase [Burkholderiaceae bacterium]|nr:MAG: class I SAM-dependent methyltransferase [Burkholderiaceae bacterium]